MYMYCKNFLFADGVSTSAAGPSGPWPFSADVKTDVTSSLLPI